MRIGIDARMYSPAVGGGGLGRYVEELVLALQKLDSPHRFVLFLKPENFDACSVTDPRFEKVAVDIHWYSLKEQVLLARRIDAHKLDLVHFPHWNVPIGLKTPFVMTVHDLILLETPRSAQATTRGPLVYWVKYLGYRLVLRRALTRARNIIAVSEYTKASILKFFPSIDPEKIQVVYEGVTDLPASPGSQSPIRTPYFLYVGNAYPHKNLESLLHAFSFFHQLHPDVKLVLAGRKDAFYGRLRKELDEIGVEADAVEFVMNPSDADLRTLYEHASLYLFPSRSEGFGLPPLEAMKYGLPVAAARSSALPEILGDAAVYFPPDDIETMVEAMETTLSDERLRASMKRKGRARAKTYSWERAAEQTLATYAS